MRDDGQFFGFTEVANGYLGRHTRFIHIPAVRDASDDATEGKGSCVTEIMDLVVRRALARRKDFMELKNETQKKYSEIMDPEKLTELSGLETQLSDTLRYYAPETDVSMEWAKLVDIDFPLPKAEVKLDEDGYKSSVQRTGHGLQRAFILTMLQHLVAAKGVEAAAEKGFLSEAEIHEEESRSFPVWFSPSRSRNSISIRVVSGTWRPSF